MATSNTNRNEPKSEEPKSEEPKVEESKSTTKSPSGLHQSKSGTWTETPSKVQ